MPVTYLAIPERDSIGNAIECIPYTAISVVTAKHIKIDSQVILTQHKKSDLVLLGNQLFEIAEELSQEATLPEFDWIKLRDLEFQEAYREKQVLLQQMSSFRCSQCPDLIQHVVFKLINSMHLCIVKKCCMNSWQSWNTTYRI